ncbi:M1 family metallopeptidase [uncultured Winogradskyella sp.]|uniref:M1 family metallopeptidase n=1 Tax=uncultured Winogradskyella sp. TaxID=395353 RepID=UPI0026168BED|nr:M1 family metallopeptidase [uncultured Winogradskyella sp.]
MKKFLFVFCLFQVIYLSAQQTEYVDFIQMNSFLSVQPDSSKIRGKVWYSLDILKSVDSIFLDAVNMNFNNVEIRIEDENTIPVNFLLKDDKIYFKHSFKEGVSYTIYFDYVATPKKALYFLKRKEDWNIWTQGQGKYTSNWLPSIDDVNEKVLFNLSITECGDYKVLANGFQSASMPLPDDCVKYHYNMQKPMSSYLVALAIGKYDVKKEVSKSGVPIELYYYPEDSAKVESTYRYTKQMFDFLEDEIGFPYPWQNYKQVPVHDFLYAGMENTSLTIFSDAFMVDDIGFNDKNYVNVNAHELAHQWFGDLVTATSGEHHWLQEGFATYYALLAEKEVFGEDYFYFKLYQNAQDLARQDQAGNGTSLLNPKSSSLTFYQRGAWVLYALRQYIGDTVFKKAVKAYLEKHQFSNVETKDFISEIEQLSGKSLQTFVKTWITDETFPFEAAVRTIYQESEYIQEYTQVNCEANSSKCADYLKYYVSDDAKVKVIAQRPQLINAATFQNGLKVRQAISAYLKYVPKNLKSEYESLLEDKSYITIENALYNLWTSFPTERSKYLSKTRNIEGFSDKNVRLLWLVLHLNTPDYNSDAKSDILAELLDYTNDYYNAELQMNAFRYLKLMNACDDLCKSNLEQAKNHHNWRMTKFAKDMLNELNNPKK